MEPEEINYLKKTRENLSCSLSILARELKKDNLTFSQLDKKLQRGIKNSKKYQEVTNQLLECGFKYKANADYLNPDWWMNYDPNTNQLKPLAALTTANVYKPKPKQPVIVEEIIKNTIRDEFKKYEEKEYVLNLAWTKGFGSVDELNNTLDIVTKYLDAMGIKLSSSETIGNECIYMYKYVGSEYNLLKRTIQYMIDVWGSSTNMSFFGKKYDI